MDRPTGGALPPDWNETQQPLLYGICGLFLALTTLSVAIRIALQLRVHRRLYWDDFWILVSMVISDALVAVNIYGVEIGLGLHADRVAATDPDPPAAFTNLWKVGIINSIVSWVLLFTVKLSLLGLYRRIFWVARWFRFAWWFNLGFLSAATVAFVFTAIFQCSPISFAWNRIYLWMHIQPPFPVHGKCISQNFVIINSAISLASDIFIWLMPMAALLKLKMSTKKKLELGAVLSLGAAACACGLGKAITSQASLRSIDVSWANGVIMIWSTAEENAAIFCACITVIFGCAKSIHKSRSKGGYSGGPRDDPKKSPGETLLGRDSFTRLNGGNEFSSSKRDATSSDSFRRWPASNSDPDVQLRTLERANLSEHKLVNGNGSVTVRPLPDNEELAMHKQAQQRNVWI